MVVREKGFWRSGWFYPPACPPTCQILAIYKPYNGYLLAT